MRKFIIALAMTTIGCATATAQHLEISSGWHLSFPDTWLTVPLDGPELVDTHDMHNPGDTDLLIPRDGYYRLKVVFVVGLGGVAIDPTPPFPNAKDRALRVQRFDALGNPAITLVQIKMAQNTTSQAFMWIENAEFLLRAGDTLNVSFRYTTPHEAQLAVIVSELRLEFTRSPPLR